jgi:hypothetical protein
VSVVRNLGRTLLKVRWQAGGECVVFPEELEEIRQVWWDALKNVFRRAVESRRSGGIVKIGIIGGGAVGTACAFTVALFRDHLVLRDPAWVLRRRNCESAFSLTWLDSATERFY